MAHKKGVGSSRNGRDSNSQRLGLKKFGGFVDPNCLMIDKVKCAHVPPLWTMPLRPRTPTADRTVFDALRKSCAVGSTGEATAYYVTNSHDENHAIRLSWIQALEQAKGCVDGVA